MDQEKRTYETILKSFVKELNERGANIRFATLSDQQKLELLDVLIKECYKHMKPFVKHVLGYDWEWYHEIWFQDYLKYKFNAVVAARGLGKSYFWTKMLPIYLAYIGTNFDQVVSSFNEAATFDFMKGIRLDYEQNEFLYNKMPTSPLSDWNKGNADFAGNNNIKAISITSQIRRLHVKNFVADDILNDEQRLSLEQLKIKIFATIIPTLMRSRGKFTLIGTRFSEDDIFAQFFEYAKDRKEYHYCEIRVELDEINEKVYLVHETEDGIQGKYEDTSDIYNYSDLLSMKMVEPNYFLREYSCQIVSDQEVPFPVDALQRCKDRSLSYQDIGEQNVKYYGGLDSSNATTKDADDTVLMVGKKDEEENIVPEHIFADNKLEAPDRLRELKKVMSKFNKPQVLAEKNNMGETNIQMINREGYNLISFNTDRPKKVDLTDYASYLVKREKVKFPYRTAKDQKITDILIHQLSGVKSAKTRGGKHTYEGTTKHDDYYIAFILLCKQLAENSKPTKVKSFKRSEL